MLEMLTNLITMKAHNVDSGLKELNFFCLVFQCQLDSGMYYICIYICLFWCFDKKWFKQIISINAGLEISIRWSVLFTLLYYIHFHYIHKSSIHFINFLIKQWFYFYLFRYNVRTAYENGGGESLLNQLYNKLKDY